MKERYIYTRFGKMYVKTIGEGEKTIIFLHGFNRKSDDFENITKRLKGYKLILVDFIGFGKSDKASDVMTLKDYVDTIRLLTLELNNDIIFVAHSFGCRVACLYASIYNVNKMFLLNGKVFKNKSIKYKLKLIKYKITKKILYIISKTKYKNYVTSCASRDYKNLTQLERLTFKNIVNYDLKKALKKIKCKTYILASIYDTEVSYKETLKMHKLVENSTLYPFVCSNHFSYQDEENKVVTIIERNIL